MSEPIFELPDGLPVPNLRTFTTQPDEILANMAIPTWAPIIIGTPLTPEERAQIQAQHQAEFDAARADWEHTRDLCVGQPAALAALDLHRITGGPYKSPECAHCELNEEPEPWPCETYRRMKEAASR